MGNQGERELKLGDVQDAWERTKKRLGKRKAKLKDHLEALDDIEMVEIFIRAQSQELINAERNRGAVAPVRKLPSKEAIQRAVREAQPEGEPVEVKEISMGKIDNANAPATRGTTAANTNE